MIKMVSCKKPVCPTSKRLLLLNLNKQAGLRTMLKSNAMQNINMYTEDTKMKSYFNTALSGAMREEILQELLRPRIVSSLDIDVQGNSNELKKLTMAISNLLSPWTKELNLDTLFALCQPEKQRAYMLKIFRLIAKLAPNIEVLSSHCFTGYLGRKRAKCLCEMKNLKVFSMERCVFHWPAFVMVCKSLPKLQELHIANFGSSMKSKRVKEIKQGLVHAAHLKILKCNTMYARVRNAMEKHLPQLHLIIPWVLLTGSSQRMQQSSLHMRLRFFDREKLREALNYYPNITSFTVNCYQGVSDTSNSLPDFPKLEHLSLERVSSEDTVDYFLFKYGFNLRSLRIMGQSRMVKPDLRFNRIFELCPKLEILDLEDVVMEDSYQQINGFSKLKELSWTSTEINPCNILLAPNLQKVTLSSSSFKLKNWNYSLLPGVLRNLEYFHVHLSTITESKFKLLPRFLTALSDRLPKLTELRFSCEDSKHKTFEYSSHATRAKNSSEYKSAFSKENRKVSYDWFLNPSLVEALQAYD